VKKERNGVPVVKKGTGTACLSHTNPGRSLLTVSAHVISCSVNLLEQQE